MRINFKRLDHIQICIPPGKEEDARKFYSGILGLKEIEKPDSLKKNGGLWYEIAGVQLHIGTEEQTVDSKRHPAFEIENLKTVREYLQDKEIMINDEIPVPGINRFSFRDTFGNRIEFLEKNKF